MQTHIGTQYENLETELCEGANCLHTVQILQPNSVPMSGYSFEANDVF